MEVTEVDESITFVLEVISIFLQSQIISHTLVKVNKVYSNTLQGVLQTTTYSNLSLMVHLFLLSFQMIQFNKHLVVFRCVL